MITIKLSPDQHKELLTMLVRYSTGREHWAVSPGLKLAIADPVPQTDTQTRTH